jgi:rRNA maturation protein Nop10
MKNNKPGLLASMLGMKCPACRKGYLYKNHGIFPLGEVTTMPEHCPVCGQKTEIETGFYFGTGYVSYALSVALFIFNFVWYYYIFGISFRDNSPYYYLVTSIAIVVVAQPWMMRISRVLYIYGFVKYNPETERLSGQDDL